jgi:hypothetical protein
MQFVSALREIDLSDEPAIARRFAICIDDAERVGLAVLAAGEQRDVRKVLRGRLGRERGGWIESWIGKKSCHVSTW